MATTNVSTVQIAFFEYLFGKSEGYLCIATALGENSNPQKQFKQYFWQWPQQKEDIVTFVERASHGKNVWFATSLFDEAERLKENALPGSIVWSEYDDFDISDVEPKPSLVVKSSTGKWHAYWRLDDSVAPDVQEDYSKRITYSTGADKGGWALTKLLRVPLTHNYKYDPPETVEIEWIDSLSYPQSIFEALPSAEATTNDYVEGMAGDMPDVDSLPDVESQVFFKYRIPITKEVDFMDLFARVPDNKEDWSKRLYRLINMSFEAGMDREEVFSVAMSAACNKYERDKRPVSYLWREVIKVEGIQKKLTVLRESPQLLSMPQLVDPDTVELDNFITEYKKWANKATDAIEQYHELSCFIMLSSMISSGLSLDASFGKLYCNLWGLVLGDSTLTRKTTAMRMATDIIYDIVPDIIVATDGSVEGLLTGISERPNQVSMFYKDEVTGFFDSINRKDYLAGMPETLTQLYDVPKILPRRLRKETITLHSPYFIFFGGGIRDKVYSLLNDQYVISGFLPRFLVVAGETDLSRIRRTGPATQNTEGGKARIRNRIADLYQEYNKTVDLKIGSQVGSMQASYEAVLSPEAWEKYGDYEMKLIEAAQNSSYAMLALPTFTRLGFSMLKMAMLLAATRGPDQANRVHVEVKDINQAAVYIQDWGRYSVDLIIHAGQSVTERSIDKVMRAVNRKPGITRSEIMRAHHFGSREMRDVLTTLHERGQIDLKQEGRGYRIYPI